MGAIQETADNIAMLKAAGVPEASISGYGGRLRNDEANAILSKFSPNITPQTVYSAGNIAQATNAPAPKPNYADPYALRDYFMNTSDMVTARENVAKSNADLLARRQTGRAQQQAIQELPQALNVIRGEQAVAGQQSALSEQAAAESLLAAQSGYDTLAQEANAKYQIAQVERGKIQDLISQTGAKAGISYADSFETALKKASKYEEKVAKEKKKELYKDTLKQSLLSLGLKTKGSTKEMEKRLRKSVKSDKEYDRKIKDIELKIKQKELNKPYYAPEKDDYEAPDFTDKGLSTLIDGAFNKGNNWEEISTKLEVLSPGITNPGSSADKYLQYKFLGGENPLSNK